MPEEIHSPSFFLYLDLYSASAIACSIKKNSNHNHNNKHNHNHSTNHNNNKNNGLNDKNQTPAQVEATERNGTYPLHLQHHRTVANFSIQHHSKGTRRDRHLSLITATHRGERGEVGGGAQHSRF